MLKLPPLMRPSTPERLIRQHRPLRMASPLVPVPEGVSALYWASSPRYSGEWVQTILPMRHCIHEQDFEEYDDEDYF